MKSHKKTILSTLCTLAMLVGAVFVNTASCSATKIFFSPMRQYKVLVPGTIEDLAVTIGVPSTETESVDYELEVRPFSVDDNNITHYEAKENYSLIVDWISLPEEEYKGTLSPNENKVVNFTINVPEDAPAGGQYCAVMIKTSDNNDAGVKQVYEMMHPVYAEVAGETVRRGEIQSLDVQSFRFSGNIAGSASVKNLGNIHSNVKHVLKVYPLIGNEEYYTNEEEPQENMVMPGATRYSAIEWENTPSLGVFRVVYTVEFEGVKNELSKVVIICPIWLLVIFMAIIVLIIYRILTSKKKGPKFQPAHKSEEE